MTKVLFLTLKLGLFGTGLIVATSLGGCSSAPPSPPACSNVLRAVVDMGSGSTKMTLAEIEKCTDSTRLLRVIDDKSGEALALEAGKNSVGEIPLDIQEKAFETLSRMRDLAKTKARELGREELEIAFVGTHAFRSAKNLPSFKAFLETKAVSVTPLTQDEEALAGVNAVKRLPVATACTPLLVWDVGGGSAQFSFEQGQENSSMGIGVGSEAFKNLLMKAPRVTKPKTTCKSKEPTPNPLGAKNFTTLLTTARGFADRQIFKLPHQTNCAVGIGGVHRKAIAEQLEKQWPKIHSCACSGQKPEEPCAATPGQYSKKQLTCLTQYLSDKSDCDEEIKGPYASTSVSNLYMVLAFMDKFGLEQIHTASVNMGSALVLDDERLNFRLISTAP